MNLSSKSCELSKIGDNTVKTLQRVSMDSIHKTTSFSSAYLQHRTNKDINYIVNIYQDVLFGVLWTEKTKLEDMLYIHEPQ